MACLSSIGQPIPVKGLPYARRAETRKRMQAGTCVLAMQSGNGALHESQSPVKKKQKKKTGCEVVLTTYIPGQL